MEQDIRDAFQGHDRRLMATEQKNQSQDDALLKLEVAHGRHDQWQHGHDEEHSSEGRERELLRHTMESRLEGMNEFRSSLKDAQTGMVSREIFDRLHDSLANRVANLERIVPIVALLSAAISAAITAAILKAVGGT